MTVDPEIIDQKFVCLSIVLPKNGRQSNSDDSNSESKQKEEQISAIKIRGVYETMDEAKARAAELQKIDPYFHIFIGDVGRWLPLDANPSSAKTQVYYEKELNDLINGEVEQVNEIKLIEEQRKRDLVLQAKRAEMEAREKLKQEGGSSIELEIPNMNEIFEQVAPLDANYMKHCKGSNNSNINITEINDSDLKNELADLETKETEEREKLKQLENNIRSKEMKLEEFEKKLEEIKNLQRKLSKK